MKVNAKDPIAQQPPPAVELFQRFSQASDGFTVEATVAAAADIMISALRQAHPTRDRAEAAWDEWIARCKAVLMECYDSTGRKKGVYPYTQHIVVPFFRLR